MRSIAHYSYRKAHLSGQAYKTGHTTTVTVASEKLSLASHWGLLPKNNECGLVKTMRFFRKQLNQQRRTLPLHTQSASSTATTCESDQSAQTTPFTLSPYLEPHSYIDIKPLPNMAAHELDLRPKSTRISSPSNRLSTAESSTPPVLTKRKWGFVLVRRDSIWS